MLPRAALGLLACGIVTAVGSEDCCLTASISGDPHVVGAHKDKFSIRGQHGGTYCMLSAPDVSLHAQFEFVIFRTSWSKMRINGSFIRAAFFVLRTPRKG
eukprot:2158729-Prymnesium_polylepis.1